MRRTLLALLMALLAPQPPVREVAVTIDDLPFASVLGQDLASARETTAALVASLRRHQVPAIGFVNEIKLETGGRVEEERVALLRQWLEAGLELGNHTRRHVDLHQVAPADYLADILAGERVTRPLVEARGGQLRFFRHPFLRTGRSAAVRGEVDAWLAARGYRVAPVTIDNYDYVFAAAYERAGDAAERARIVDAYLEYMTRIFAYYEAQADAIAGRPIRHTLLLHASALNAAAFDALAGMMRSRGYRFVPLAQALEDPVYARRDEYFGPAGITWLHRWALTEGKRGGIFAGEPAVPDWITRVSERR